MELLLILRNQCSSRQKQKFTKEECRQIRRAVNEAKQKIKTLPLDARVRSRIGAKLDQLSRKAVGHKPVDWLALFTGTLTALLTALSVPDDLRKAIWTVVNFAMDKYLAEK